MTKYILAGGNDREDIQYGKSLSAEIRKTKQGPITVLSCFFSQPVETWQERAGGFEDWFKNILGPNIKYVIASEVDFLNQIQQADVIYLHGGDNKPLLDKLGKYTDLHLYFKDKIVIGSSAGAMCLAERSWYCDSRLVESGLGIVPTNTIVHYDSDYAIVRGMPFIDWTDALNQLRDDVGIDAPISKLREGQFEVFET